ncbi:ABC transporter ATP-binding protein [Saccharothrix texasensis]|uniref:ABC-2 type transport system ATP-binding protein n=1 Tax=Saccharothrix texasensis TaxID=103734 RepID=A0A3N1HJT4_9PSEU|nr:ABC transporter ATP-binding protein [Saccharothrix texasensis]ROP42721.1 ABC-2 type transport system ATP-binding protein [Saccharothrix texasensis]
MPLIETTALGMRYDDKVTALADLTLDIEAGVVGLVGVNGAGKTTLIKLALGLLTPTSGRIRVLGLDPIADGEQVRAKLGYMPEHDCLPPDMVAAEFVTHMARVSGLPAAAARERASETLRHVGLYEERYRRIGGYSTGMKQRVKLAQALVHDPELLLLDEPTNGLDPAGRRAMLDLVHRIGTEFGISVVVCSHLLGEIERICTSLVAIDAGTLLRSATLSSMTEHNDLLVVEVDEGAERLATALATGGVDVRRDNRVLTVRLGEDDGAVYDLIRDAVADLDLSLHRLERQRHQVADLFRDRPAEEVSHV